MHSKDLIDFLHQYCQEGSEAVLKKGYRWFNTILTPNLKQFSEQHNEESELLGEAWLITGEVHELILAPNQAITCYIIAKHYSPFSSDIYRWLALVQESLGQYLEAINNIEKSLKYTNDGEALMEDRQRIQDCMVYDKVPDFIEGNLVWKYNEYLAEGKFDKIVKNSKKQQTTDIELLKCFYRAYGGLQDKDSGEKVWQKILALEADAILDEVDLFYWH